MFAFGTTARLCRVTAFCVGFRLHIRLSHTATAPRYHLQYVSTVTGPCVLPPTMAESSSDEPSTSTPGTTASTIQHMPRKRASMAPKFDGLPEFQADRTMPAATGAAKQLPDPLLQPRVGPLFVKYSVWAGGAAIAYTYLSGFRAMFQKNNTAWMHTFRQRVWIMSPLIAMYITGSGLVPLPFRSQLENFLGRKAFTLQDYSKAERELRARQLAAKVASEDAASGAFADKHLTTKL